MEEQLKTLLSEMVIDGQKIVEQLKTDQPEYRTYTAKGVLLVYDSLIPRIANILSGLPDGTPIRIDTSGNITKIPITKGGE